MERRLRREIEYAVIAGVVAAAAALASAPVAAGERQPGRPRGQQPPPEPPRRGEPGGTLTCPDRVGPNPDGTYTVRVCWTVSGCDNIVLKEWLEPGHKLLSQVSIPVEKNCVTDTFTDARWDAVVAELYCGDKLLSTCRVELEKTVTQPAPAPGKPAPEKCPEPPKNTVKLYETEDGHRVAVVKTQSRFGGPWYNHYGCFTHRDVAPNCKCLYTVVYEDCAGGRCAELSTEIVVHGKDLPAWIMLDNLSELSPMGRFRVKKLVRGRCLCL